MDPNTAHRAATAAKQNNTLLYGGVAAAALLGYYWYKKRSGDVQNVGDAVSMSQLACFFYDLSDDFSTQLFF